jgi:prevent-host-death family protein
MTTVAIEEAARRLPQLVEESQSGEDVVLTRADRPVAKIVGLRSERPQPRRGSGRDFIARIAPDFGETPKGFEEYMP